MRIQHLRYGAALIPFPRRYGYTGAVKAQTALSPLKGKKPAEGINFPLFRCLPSASLTPCACFPRRSGDKSGLLSPDSLARTPRATCLASSHGLEAPGRVRLQTGTYRLESPADLLPKCNFGSALLCPQNKTSLHCTAAAARSRGRCHPQRGSGLKSPLVSHPRMLALTPHLLSGLLGPLQPPTWLAEHQAGCVRGGGAGLEGSWAGGRGWGQVCGTAVTVHG